jgi:hypothetical protein
MSHDSRAMDCLFTTNEGRDHRHYQAPAKAQSHGWWGTHASASLGPHASLSIPLNHPRSIDDVCVNVSRRSDIYRNGRQVSLCSCSCPLFRWRVARYDRVAVSPRLPLPPVAVGGIIAMVMGQKSQRRGAFCVCEKTGPPPVRVGFRFPPIISK